MFVLKKIVWICLLLSIAAWAQIGAKMPLVLGGTLEVGTGVMNDDEEGSGIVRITPFAGAWIQGLGYFRVGYGMYDFTTKPDGKEKYAVKHRDLSIQLGVAIGPGPYAQVSYARAKNLSAVGDVAWHEWGVGIGTTFQLSAMAALVSELEYRWILSHYDPIIEENVSGSRLQLNLGFVIYVY